MGRSISFTRREFCAIAGGAAASIVSGSACRGARTARLTARPRDGVMTFDTGQIKLGLDDQRS